MRKIWNGMKKDWWIVLLDIAAVNAAYILALLLRYSISFKIKPGLYYLIDFWVEFTPWYTLLAIPVFALFRLYGGMWRFAGINDMNRILGASGVTAVIHVIGTAAFLHRMPISYYLIGAFLQLLMISMIRFSYRIFLVEKKKMAGRNIPVIPAMIIGAGETARRAIQHLEDTPFRATVVVDGKSAGKTLDGVPITADWTDLSKVQAVFIADPDLSAEKRKEIREYCEKAGIELQDYTGYLSNLVGRIPLASLLELSRGPVTLVIDGKEQRFANGEEALSSLGGRYEIHALEGLKAELGKPSAAAYAGYDAWAQQHQEETGEEVSFF